MKLFLLVGPWIGCCVLVVGCNQDALPSGTDGSSPDGAPTAANDASTSVDLQPQVILDGALVADLAVMDLSTPPVIDMATRPLDLAQPLDFLIADLTSLPDLLPPPDLTGVAPSDMANPFPPFVPPIAPHATHVGVTAATCCLVTHPSGHALYLANFDPRKQIGDLHLVDSAGSDKVLLLANAPVFGYDFTDDGTYAYYLAPVPNHNDALHFVQVANPSNDTIVVAQGIPASPLDQVSFVTPSKKYLILGVQEAGINSSLDMHIIDLVAHSDIYSAFGQGAFDYLETVTDQDVMLYQNIVGGNNPMTPGTNTLFSVSLPGLTGGATPTAIDTRTGSIQLTPDYKTLVYSNTSGALNRYDIASRNVTPITASGPDFNVGPSPQGPIAWVAADLSVHVATFATDVWSAPAGSSDLFSQLYLSPDAQHVYFFKNVDSQDFRGDLYEGALPPLPAGPPRLVATGASMTLYLTADHLFYYANVPILGAVGDLTSAELDGSNPVKLGTTSLVDQMAIPAPPYSPVYAALTPGMTDPTVANSPIDGTPASYGALGISRSPSGPLAPLDANVHSKGFHYDDDRRLLVYAGTVAWSPAASNYVGALQLHDIGAATTTAVGVSGVSEIGAVTKRSLFVNAPTANPAGVYYVTY